MDLGLKDKVVVVTGGSKGIGFACAKAFLGEGARVALVSRSEPNLAAATAALGASGGRLTTFACDLIDPASGPAMVAAVESRFGPIDVLVNSAGAARRYAPEELSPAAYRQAMDAKYFTYVHAVDAVVHGMAKRGRGAIVNIIGSGGKAAGLMHIAGGSANSALMLTTVGLAAAYAAKGIRVNGINPGMTMTTRVDEGLAVEARATGVSREEALEKATQRIPMGRGAEPDEIAAVAAFLASEPASYVTGAIVPMDGGAMPVI